MALFNRMIHSEIEVWEAGYKASALIEGAPGSGKTQILKALANNGTNSIYLDCKHLDDKVKDCFENHLVGGDFEDAFRNATGYDMRYKEGKVLLDNIEYYPRAREAMEFLTKATNAWWLGAGSFVNIPQNIEHIRLPGNQQYMTLNPMSFSEFLEADGWFNLLDALEVPDKIGEKEHEALLGLFSLYLFCGGMPGPVDAFIETHDLCEVAKKKQEVLLQWKESLEYWGAKDAWKVLKAVPVILEKKNPMFPLGEMTLEESKKAEELLDILTTAKMLHTSIRASGTISPSTMIPPMMPFDSIFYVTDPGLFLELMQPTKEEVKDLLLGKWQGKETPLLKNVSADLISDSSYSGVTTPLWWAKTEKSPAIPYLFRNGRRAFRTRRPSVVCAGVETDKSSVVKDMEEMGTQVWKEVRLTAGRFSAEKNVIRYPIYASEGLEDFIENLE